MAYQDITFIAGEVLDEAKLNQLMENQREATKRQYGRFFGTGSVVSGFFTFPTVQRSKGAGLITRQTSGGDALYAVEDCWVDWKFIGKGNSSHAYTHIVQYFAAGGSEQLGWDATHEGSTVGYTMSGSTFMNAGDRIRFGKDYWPSAPSEVIISFTASKHVE
jgi:hypothetical protein